MDPQARRNSLSAVRSFLLRLSLDDERDPVLAMEASAMARVMDDVLNGGVEQEILASLGRIEAGLGVIALGGEDSRLLMEVLDNPPAPNAALRALMAKETTVAQP